MSDATPLPALKSAIEAIEIQHEGQPMVLLRDQEGLNEQSMAVSLPGFVIASLLNGKNGVGDIQSIFAKSTGTMLQATEIERLVAQLDKADLLETDALKAKRKRILEDFQASPVRKAGLVNAAYPADRMELAAYLARFFRDPKGPGKEFAAAPAGARPPLGLVSPHIDFERGGPAYAWAYQALSEAPPPDVVVALGVAHMSPNSPWVLTPKRYETPYGDVAADVPLSQEIQKALWYDGRTDEWTHRREHSLEFQALWLKYLWRDATPPWVPILCSNFERFSPDTPPSSVATVEDAIQRMGAAIKAQVDAGRTVTILAGVDLAHVGPRFGDQLELNAELEKRVETEDRASIDHALTLDADRFYLSVVADGHWRKVCGLSALYTALRLMSIVSGGKAEGKFLAYGQAPDPLGGIVSFTSLIYPG